MKINKQLNEAITLRNEFAAVRLELCTAGNGSRLKIINLDTGDIIFLDPFEVASLVWARSEIFDQLATPI